MKHALGFRCCWQSAICVLLVLGTCNSWVMRDVHSRRHRVFANPVLSMSSEEMTNAETSMDVAFDSLIDMDIVIYSKMDDPNETKYLAALQEDGGLSPLSTWTLDPAFDEAIEVVVDENDRFALQKIPEENLKLHYLVDESELSYGSRQCHRGVHNPHGEESELLYYVIKSVLEKFDVHVEIKPYLEVLW